MSISRLVNSLVPLQHLDKFANLADSCLRLLHGLNTKQHGVSIRTIERLKEFSSSRTRIQRCLEILRNLSPFGRVIRRIPTTVFLRGLYRFEAGSFHPAIRDQRDSFVTVDL